jgi:hypothetical protein
MKEKDLHKAVCRYIKKQYPKVAFETNMNGVWLAGKWSLMLDVKNNNSSPGAPDLKIWHRSGQYNGLAIELKAEGKSAYKRNGELRDDDHLRSQKQWLDLLTSLGWKAVFATGFDEAKIIIDLYLNDKLQAPKL